jgi:hypothetical protein
MDRESFKLLTQYGPPGQWSGAVAGTMNADRRAMLQRAWRAATKGEKARINQSFAKHMETDMPATYEMDAGERSAAKASDKALAGAKAADANDAQTYAVLQEKLAELGPDVLDSLATELNEALAMIGLPPLTGGTDPKLSRALVLTLGLVKAAGIKFKVPDFTAATADTSVGAVRSVIQSPEFADFIDEQKAGEMPVEDDVSAEEPEPVKKDKTDLFRSRASVR